ncbi:MAG TPA: YiiX/YebB-like N1pC/P60 family cysteine hydrolase [Symbiobacteriaceae bacterium]|nr:YiiX/YebB-like N1pC/P60 family cysteine hydrolase [Symbiobacteriaceae bacterium]
MKVIKRSLAFGALALVLLIGVNVLTMRPSTKELWRFMWAELGQGNFGVGRWDGEFNEFDFSQLEPGDIVLGGNTGSSWGYWTHAALYIGNGQVMETFLQPGTKPEPVTRYNEYYSHAGALRVKLPPEVKQRAVERALALEGRPWYLLASRSSEELWYCSKIVWWVYAQEGYDMDPDGPYWIVPDRIARSPLVEQIQPHGR